MKRPEMEMNAEMLTESKEVERKEKRQVRPDRPRRPRSPREKERKKKGPTTVTIPWDQATRRSEEGVLCREKPRKARGREEGAWHQR